MITIINRQPKPFCDTDGSSHDYSVSDFCDPCPKNGECVNGNLECRRGYRKHGRSCVEDGEINQTTKELSKWIELQVCEAYVGFLCDGIGTVWVPEAKMLEELEKQELKEKFGMKNDSYAYTKQKAIETVQSSLETRKGLRGFKELKCPDQLVEQYKPLSCCVREWVLKNAFFIVPTSALLVGLVIFVSMILRRIHRSRLLSDRAEHLYQQICDILEEKAMTAKTFTSEGEPWVVASWLRDDLLSPKERKDPYLWKKFRKRNESNKLLLLFTHLNRRGFDIRIIFFKVEEMVLEDSRLDQYPKLVRGESKVVWEWQVEGSLSSSRKRKKEQIASKMIFSEGGHGSSPAQQQRQTPKPGILFT